MKKYPFVNQNGIAECGVCCLLMIIKTYGGRVSKEYLRDLVHIDKNGVSALSLIEASHVVGMDAKGVNGDYHKIEANMLPLIAHVIIDKSYKHFVVIYSINFKKKKILIADPAKGLINYSFDDFDKITTNNYLLFNPKKVMVIDKTNKYHLIMSFLRNNWKLMIGIILLSIFYTILNILSAYHFKAIIDNVLITSSIKNLTLITFIMLFIVSFKCLSDYLRSNILTFINHKLDYHLFSNVYQHLISLPYRYYRNRTTGEVISRLNDLSEVRDTFSQIIMGLIIDLLLLVIVILFLFRINNALSLILLGLLAVYIIIYFIFTPLLHHYVGKIHVEGANVNNYLVETLGGIESIKGMNVENTIINKANIKYSNYLTNSYIGNKILNLQNFLKKFLGEICLIIIICFGTILCLKDEMTVGELIAYNGLIGYFLQPLHNLLQLGFNIKASKIAYKRLIELYEIASENLKRDDKYLDCKIKGSINCINIDYTYNNRNILLNKINIRINAGDKVLLYGESGSGKSTLAKILAGYFQVSNGKLEIDDQNINDYNLLNLREQICYVSQKEKLFTGSIYENITLNRNIDYNDFLKVTKLCLTDSIITNNVVRYDMLIEEDGFNISGGEKQRIILARSILKKANIYIFDESLSEIDIANEKVILQNIFNDLNNKTVIVISHRFANESLFDRKINIQKGYCYE